jgi:hypothetical protein
MGEAFRVEIDEDGFWLVHPRWSLIGLGRDLIAAEISLAREIKDVFRMFTDCAAEEFDEEAQRERAFILAAAPMLVV